MWPILFIGAALASDCDLKALQASLKEASPIAVPRAYVNLAKCDQGAAKQQAESALKRTLAGSDANEAVLAALNAGAEDEVRSWLKSLEPDQRSRTIKFLGRACKDSKSVSDFFVVSQDLLGPDFWKERWHRGLTDCRNEDIQYLLTTALDDPYVGRESQYRDKFFAFLEVYARNLGEKSLPLLHELITTTEEEREKTLLISLYADAANVGSTEGINSEVAAKAAADITALGPDLPAKSIDQARDTLVALGSPDVASSFAKFRWPDRTVNGAYLYKAAAHEIVTCKNEKKVANFHYGEFTETGNLWPNELNEKLSEILTTNWSLNETAEKCKGNVELHVTMILEPLPGSEDPKEWLGRSKAAFQESAKGISKTKDILHETFVLE